MKNSLNFTWFLTAIAIFLAGNLVFVSCEKDAAKHPVLPQNATEAQERSDGTSILKFEEKLNAEMTIKRRNKSGLAFDEISFGKNDLASLDKQQEVVKLIENKIQGKKGKKPFFIDVNVREHKIILGFESDEVGQTVLRDPRPSCGGTYAIGLAQATNCSLDRFNGAANLRPNGGIPQVFCNAGTFCDNTSDLNCGGLGRIANAFKASIPLPDNHSYFTDIMDLDMLGWRNNYTVGSIADGVIEFGTSDLWYLSPGFSSVHPLCFSNTNLNNYYCKIWQKALPMLPTGYYIIDVSFAKFDTHFVPNSIQPGYHWYIRLKIGKAVQCCDCCC